MQKSISAFLVVLFFYSCKIQQDKGGDYDKYDPAKTYKLQLNPTAGFSYHYDFTNETTIKLEVDDKKINNLTRTEAGVTYKIGRDSVGNFLFTSTYDKLHIYTKNNDEETELDAANASFSLDPTEKMLGVVKKATIQVTLTSGGEIKSMTGYNEIGEEIMAAFAPTDIAGKKAAQEQWDKFIGGGLIKKNFDQLFKVFPDSAVHLGDTWRLTSRQEGELSLNVTGSYKLKAINSEIAIIESEGKISGGNAANEAIGLGATIADLTGEQSGQFEMETKTGMLISCKIKAEMKGTVNVMGREIPVKITASVRVNGKKTVAASN